MPSYAGEIEDAVNQPADLLIRAEACDLCRIGYDNLQSLNCLQAALRRIEDEDRGNSVIL